MTDAPDTMTDLTQAIEDAIWDALNNDPNDPWGRGYVSRETGTIDAHDIDMGNVAAKVAAVVEAITAKVDMAELVEARKVAVDGWMGMFQTVNGEWGPYDAEHYLTKTAIVDEPEWLQRGVAEELAKVQDFGRW